MTFQFKLLALAAAMGAVAVAAIAGETPGRIEWRVQDNDVPAGEVDLQLTHRRDRNVTSYGRGTPLADLQGLTAAQLGSPDAQVVRFRLARDAGAFDCQGSAMRETGSGVCDFVPGRAFAERLAAAGMGRADDGQLLSLAMADVGADYLDELRRQRYATPSVDELVRAAHHGVSLRYLKEMDAVGYRRPKLSDLVTLRDHGVNARYVEGLKAAGYGDLPVEQVRRLRDHGVSTSFMKEMAQLGRGRFAAEDLVRLRDHGVSARFVAELGELGYRELSPDDLIRLRIHGVSTGFIRRANADGSRRDADELVRLRLHRER